MECKINFLCFIIILVQIIEINSIIIHPLNTNNQACILEISNVSDYYFYSSIKGVKMNEIISYFISEEITKFKISYYFVESDKFETLNDSNINNYSFNETIGFIEYYNPDNSFINIYKTNNNQKGLLLKIKILNYENSNNNLFNILRIDPIQAKPDDFTISISGGEVKYFYINKDYYLQYDILVFSSYGKKIIYYYYPKNSKFSDTNYNFLFFDDLVFSDRMIKVMPLTYETFLVNIKFLPKNTIIMGKIWLENVLGSHANQIKLSFPNSGYHDIYYLGNNKYHYYFLKNISGQYESSYIYLEDVYNLDDVLPDKNNIMKPFHDNLELDGKEYLVLFHFKSINNNPALLEINSIDYRYNPEFREDLVSHHILLKEINYSIKNYKLEDKDVSVIAEYLGCKFEGDEGIKITLEDGRKIILNKSINKIIFNINLKYRDNYIYSSQFCGIVLAFGEREKVNFNITEESFNNTMKNWIAYQYPKIEEDIHYHFYFYYEKGADRPNCFLDFVDSNYFYNLGINGFFDNYNFLMNPYNLLDKNKNLTYVFYCQHQYPETNTFFNIIKLKQEKGILDKFFRAKNYTEYKFDKITKKTKILFQIKGYFSTLKDEKPSLYIGDYAIYISTASNYYILAASKDMIPKVVMSGTDLVLKVSYLDNDIDIYSRISESKDGFNITSDESGIYKLSIMPLLYNENIKYIIHACPFDEDFFYDNAKYIYERTFENFGDITINTTFTKNSSDVFEYTFSPGDKINNSYTLFILIAKDLRTGYTVFSGKKNCNYIYKESKDYTTLIIILASGFVFLVLLVVIIICCKKRRKRKSEEIYEAQELLND